MSVSYNRLWKQLIDKNMKRIEMQHLTGIIGNILARMGKNQYVSMETIEKRMHWHRYPCSEQIHVLPQSHLWCKLFSRPCPYNYRC